MCARLRSYGHRKERRDDGNDDDVDDVEEDEEKEVDIDVNDVAQFHHSLDPGLSFFWRACVYDILT